MNETELLNDVAVKVGAMYKAACEESEPVTPESFGQRVTDMLSEDWGGINVYIPKGKNSRLQQRNARMWKEYTVDKVSLAELARRYGISEQRAYSVLAIERERHRQKQYVLPGMLL